MFGRVVRRAVIATSGVTCSGFALYAQYDPGVSRSLEFWCGVMPVYATYRFHQTRLKLFPPASEKERDDFWNSLHEEHAPVIEKLILRLKGFYLKQAQFMSTQDEFVPGPYMSICKKMQNEVPSPLTAEPDQARKLVCSALGCTMNGKDDPFIEFSPQPIAAASIGQVHRARLRPEYGGEEVAVKLQYPGIEPQFRVDMDTTIRFCEFAMPSQVAGMKEIRKQFLTEFDYVAEGAQQERIRLSTMSDFGDKVVIPKVHTDLCRRTVLVQDWIEGPTLIKGIRAQFADYARKQGTTLEELERKQKEGFKNGTIHLHSIETEKFRYKLLRVITVVQDWSKNIMRTLYNYSIRLIIPGAQKKSLEWSPPAVDLASILLLLNTVHATQLFLHDTGFNGDPHPGNILLCPDGRIGLVDYGQVKILTPEFKKKYAQFVLALAKDTSVGRTNKQLQQELARAKQLQDIHAITAAEKAFTDRTDVINSFVNLGMRTSKMVPEVLYRLACFWSDREDYAITEGKNLSEFIDALEAIDPALDTSEGDGENFVMPARLSILMRGMANAFGIRLRTSTLWKPMAEEYLRQQQRKC